MRTVYEYPTIVIYKYPIIVTDEFELTLPQGAEILHVAVQNHRPYLWVLIDPKHDSETRRFAVRGTGHPVSEDLRYLGSFLLYDDTFVGHLFERIASADHVADLYETSTGAAA